MAIKFLKKPIMLTFDDLRCEGKSLRESVDMADIGDLIRMTRGDLHSGSTFHGTITLDEENMDQLNKMFEAGLQPVFWISPVWDTRRDEQDVSEDSSSG
jgi:hypothetical protein